MTVRLIVYLSSLSAKKVTACSVYDAAIDDCWFTVLDVITDRDPADQSAVSAYFHVIFSLVPALLLS